MDEISLAQAPRLRQGARGGVDVETLEMLAVIVTDDTVSDGRAFASLIEQALERGVVARGVLADGAYDTREAFDLLDAVRIEAGIKIGRGASKGLMGGTLARPRAVREVNRIGLETLDLKAPDKRYVLKEHDFMPGKYQH